MFVQKGGLRKVDGYSKLPACAQIMPIEVSACCLPLSSNMSYDQLCVGVTINQLKIQYITYLHVKT